MDAKQFSQIVTTMKNGSFCSYGKQLNSCIKKFNIELTHDPESLCIGKYTKKLKLSFQYLYRYYSHQGYSQ